MPSMTTAETPTTRAEFTEAIISDLKGWRDEGFNRPAIPVYADLDGDGVPDYYALDTFGRLIVVSADDIGSYDRVDELNKAEVGP